MRACVGVWERETQETIMTFDFFFYLGRAQGTIFLWSVQIEAWVIDYYV